MHADESQRRPGAKPADDQASNGRYLRQDPAETAHDEDNCPVIRANQVFLSAANSGRLRVVFF
jgi:hypothetical protein